MRRHRHILWAGLSALALAACDPLGGDGPAGVKPQARPDRPAAAPAPKPKLPSDAALRLARYYSEVQSDLLARGLLRTDGGGPDTPFTESMLVRNFERIALAEEYTRGGGLEPSSGDLNEIKKWTGPVRIGVIFGDTVPDKDRATDRRALVSYTARLRRITGHPISFVPRGANFHVLVMGEDDKDELRRTLDRIAPGMEPSSRAIFANLPRAIHCLVVAFADSADGSSYRQAVALVRAEHPELTRRACYHEELAQGLGLANDDQNARPSIFNDDEEFALLTSHDELLLKMLYDPRLRPGMTAEEAGPIIRILASEALGSGPS
ncbi:DUF2927 domain-containing protein [Marivita sp. GX14005]|uniref:DUF2927 domain-containing protein n=1 Tax=Marivita sp. GX14005 TaxID=2942276 RepID=UPI00201A0794|nr:DUF2927 domain-containing protein [Marivita sp. GX14005]MCL3882062.1 DUF2927 domain-containing protein [Marivita sp. GX14005]